MYLERTYTLEKKRSVLPLHTILLFLLGTPTMKKIGNVCKESLKDVFARYEL